MTHLGGTGGCYGLGNGGDSLTLIASSVVRSCKIIRDPAEFLALENEWRSLFDRVPGAYLAQSFDWCWAGWETVAAPCGRRLFVFVLREEERAVLIWPLVEAKYGPCRVLRPLGSGASEYLNLLVEEGPEMTRRVATAWEMLQRTRGVDVLNLVHVRSDTALYGCSRRIGAAACAYGAPYFGSVGPMPRGGMAIGVRAAAVSAGM
jgi:CelD/BcsL family acetyltransferase involved in cellulose biosynthesis